MAPSVSAALLVIGDEILSGRTKDKNIGYIAEYLTEIGIDLREVRVIPDEESGIVDAVTTLRQQYTYLFTTGGIGPTHDDITADSVAKALAVPIAIDERARAMLLERYKPEDLNEARLRMARIPQGADLIPNSVSKAPGFWISNVIVMAGVPAIMQAMLDEVGPRLKTGIKMMSATIEANDVPEGIYAAGLADIAAVHSGVSIGSYPSFSAAGFLNKIVVRSKDPVEVAAAKKAVEALIARLKTDRVP